MVHLVQHDDLSKQSHLHQWYDLKHYKNEIDCCILTGKWWKIHGMKASWLEILSILKKSNMKYKMYRMNTLVPG